MRRLEIETSQPFDFAPFNCVSHSLRLGTSQGRQDRSLISNLPISFLFFQGIGVGNFIGKAVNKVFFIAAAKFKIVINKIYI